MSKYALDSSAILALLNEEPGKDRVKAALKDSIISSVNYCEVLTKLSDSGFTEAESIEIFRLLNLPVINFDRETARIAARLRSKTKRYGLSLGDRSCLALALVRNLKAVTAERIWSKLKIGVRIEIVR